MDIVSRGVCTCGICGGVVRRPKTLPCYHSFCERCLHQYVDRPVREGTLDGEGTAEQPVGETAEAGNAGRDGDSPACPVCQASFPVPEGGITTLKTDLFLQRLAREITYNNVVQMCGGVCSTQSKKTAAVFLCKECDGGMKFLCKECSGHHALFCPKHTVVPLQMEAGVELRDEEVEVELPAENTYCADHPEEKMKVFCSGCFKVRCGECNTTKNSECVCDVTGCLCKWASIEPGPMKLMEFLQSSLKQKSVVLDQHGVTYSSVLKLLEGDKSSAIEAVEATYQSIVDMALERKMSLISQIHAAYQSHHDTAKGAMDEGAKNRKAVSDQLAYCTALLSCGTFVEALKCYPNLKSAADRTCNGQDEIWKTKKSLWYSSVVDETVKKTMIENVFGVIVSGVSLKEFKGRMKNPIGESEGVAYSPVTDTILFANREVINSYCLQGDIVRQQFAVSDEVEAMCFSADMSVLYQLSSGSHPWLTASVFTEYMYLSRTHSYNKPSFSNVSTSTPVKMYALDSRTPGLHVVVVHQGTTLEVHVWPRAARRSKRMSDVPSNCIIAVGDNSIFSVTKHDTIDCIHLAHLISAVEMNKFLEGTDLQTDEPHIWKLTIVLTSCLHRTRCCQRESVCYEGLS